MDIETTLEITNWDEQRTAELDDGAGVATADVTLGEGPDGLGPATMQSVLYYRPDGTSSYVVLMHVRGTLDGRAGSFVLAGNGTYDGTTARSEMTVVEGSGTGELAGISGSADSPSTQADNPNMPLRLQYDVSAAR